jgi:hypothetical protein
VSVPCQLGVEGSDDQALLGDARGLGAFLQASDQFLRHAMAKLTAPPR